MPKIRKKVVSRKRRLNRSCNNSVFSSSSSSADGTGSCCGRGEKRRIEAIKKQVKNNAVTFLLSLTCVEFWKDTSSSASAATTTSLLCSLYSYFFFSLETDKIKGHFYNYFLS